MGDVIGVKHRYCDLHADPSGCGAELFACVLVTSATKSVLGIHLTADCPLCGTEVDFPYLSSPGPAIFTCLGPTRFDRPEHGRIRVHADTEWLLGGAA